MKRTKRIASVLLALVMALSLITTAFAAGENGSITIDNAVVGQTYTIYQILDLESYDAKAGAYAYRATTAWNAFINSDAIKGPYVNVDAQGYVTWVKKADVAAFAKLAQKYAADHNIANQGTKTADSTTVEFTNLDLGYYLVDSTLGTICSLDTTNPSVTIKEKNAAPTNVKEVEEDSTSKYGTANDADIGQTVNFKSTITAQAGAENYVFHDKMSAGLQYTGVTGITLNGVAVGVANYEVKTTGIADGCTFEVVFTQAFCDTLKANDKIVISYTAVVTKDAVIGGDGNLNQSQIEYGENGKTTTTPPSETKTYTWKLDVLKYTMKGDEKTPLAGAKFTLSKNSNGSDPISLVEVGKNVYRVATKDDVNTITEITTDATGAFTIQGLDSDTYYLTETAAPAGYNVLKSAIEVKVSDKGEVTYIYDGVTATGTVEVENKTGAELPSTGGIGTTIFYVVGGLLVVAAGVLLVTRKRMSKSED